MTSLRSDSSLGAGALFDLAVDVLAGVVCPQAFPMGFRESEDSGAIGQVLLSPGSELGLTFRVGFDEVLEAFFGMGTVVGVENNSDVCGDLALEVLFGDLFLGVLLKVELAALPRSAVQRGFERRF